MKTLKNFIIITITVLLIVPFESSAQRKVEITHFVGYQFGGRIRFYEGELRVKDNANFGVALSTEIRPNVQFEVSWSQMKTSANFRPNYDYEYLSGSFDVNVNYFQAGGIWEMDKGKLRPYGLFSLGATWFDAKKSSIEDAWRFSIALGGGLKIWLSDHIGIRLQGRLLLPMYFSGAGLFCGIGTGGSGCGVSVGTGSTIVQGDFTGGLIFAFGK